MKIVTAAEMREMEQEGNRIGLPPSVLMENAGKSVAREVRRTLGSLYNRNILLLAGPGNNGGDGLVSGRYLHDWGAGVSIYLFKPRAADDINFNLIKQRGIDVTLAPRDKDLRKLDELLSKATIVIDAVFGTGNNRPISGIFSRVLARVSEVRKERPSLHIIALDLPSGLDADSGATDPACIYADDTLTLGFPKRGLFHLPGSERAGKLTVLDIGIPAALAEKYTDELLEAENVKPLLPYRSSQANKGAFGRVMVIAGSINYTGAAYLACSGAIRTGAGLVTLATPGSLLPILATKMNEVTYLPLPEERPGVISPAAARLIHEEIKRYDVLLAGCGLGQDEATARFVCDTLFQMRGEKPSLVLDADALNNLAKVPDWWRLITDNTIITPHPGEMSRLTHYPIEQIQRDRIGMSKKMATRWHKMVVLKGAYTVIASPAAKAVVSPFTNPGLASAGTGDVLAGVIAGVLAQGLSLLEAASLGVYLHGEAGEMVRNNLGDAGMIASDLLPVLPLATRKLKQVQSTRVLEGGQFATGN